MKLWMSVLAAFLIMGIAGVAQAKKDKSDKAVVGQISSVASDGNSIVVSAGRKKNATEVTVTVDKDTSITIDGKKGAVGDLKSGMYVAVTPSTGTAKSITASLNKPERKSKKDPAPPAPTPAPAPAPTETK